MRFFPLRPTLVSDAAKRTLAVAVFALSIPAAAAVALVAPADAREEQVPFRGGPQRFFTATCDFSHRNHDDAIVFPGGHGRSHAHDYFGSTLTDASSTIESLRSGPTTCNVFGDTAAYWTPALLANGRPVDPLRATVFYEKPTLGTVRAFPPGLKMIAGNSQARAAQDLHVTGWNCSAPGPGETSAIRDCPADSQLVLRVSFPSCWNGRDLDSVDHKSHMAYALGRSCPTSHPVPLPQLDIYVQYPSIDGHLELSSGGEYSAHADFINSWNQRRLTRLVNVHLNGRRR